MIAATAIRVARREGVVTQVAALQAQLPDSLLVGCRSIGPGDEFALLPEEIKGLEAAATAVRCASGAARLVARTLLARLGYRERPLPRLPSGAALWPNGIVGSLAHDRSFAIALVARARRLAAVGVDIEPAEPLPAELMDVILTAREHAQTDGDPVLARLLFCAKEAVYKALHPLDGRFIGFSEIDVDLATGVAITRSGYRLRVYSSWQPRLIAVATLTGPARPCALH